MILSYWTIENQHFWWQSFKDFYIWPTETKLRIQTSFHVNKIHSGSKNGQNDFKNCQHQCILALYTIWAKFIISLEHTNHVRTVQSFFRTSLDTLKSPHGFSFSMDIRENFYYVPIKVMFSAVCVWAYVCVCPHGGRMSLYSSLALASLPSVQHPPNNNTVQIWNANCLRGSDWHSTEMPSCFIYFKL